MPPKKKTLRGKYPRGRPQNTLVDNSVDNSVELSETEQRLHEYQRELSAECDETKQENLVKHIVQLLYGFEARSGQIDCILWMLKKKRDLILVAKTSFGKSLIMQVLPCLMPSSIVIILVPLLALGFEQEEKIRHLGSVANPIFVHGNNVGSPCLLQHIREGRYTHILTSPELFVGPRFRPLLHDPTFRHLVKWVVVDELHLVSTWGRDFRKAYALLQKTRNVIGNKPWFGCTATLDDPIFREVCDLAAFKETTEIKRFSIDRQDVAIVRVTVQRLDKMSFKYIHFIIADAAKRRDGSRLTSKPNFHKIRESNFQLGTLEGQLSRESQSSAFHAPYRSSSLRWAESLTPDSFSQPSRTSQNSQSKSFRRANRIQGPEPLPPAAELTPSPESIPKTLIFANSRVNCCKMVDSIRKWLKRLGYSDARSQQVVKPYYSTLIEVDKRMILEEFAKTNTELRILIATDALAHGKDIPDIDIVVIYGFPLQREPSIFLQMFGRAARAPERKGMAILIGDGWAIGNSEVQARHPMKAQNCQQNFEEDTSSLASETNFGSDAILSCSNLPSDTCLPSSPPRIMNLDSLITATASERKSQRRTNSDRRAELPRAVSDFMNTNSCLRRVFLRWFREPEIPSDYPREWCCSNCNPVLDITDQELAIAESSELKPDDNCPEFEDKLRKWLQSWIDSHLQCYDFPALPEHLFSKKQITEIARYSFPPDRQAIHNFLKTTAGIKRLGEDAQELVNFIMEEKENMEISTSIPSSRRTSGRRPQTPTKNLGRPGKRRALSELNPNMILAKRHKK